MAELVEEIQLLVGMDPMPPMPDPTPMPMPMMMMPMWFWKGTDLTWLIHGVESKTGGQYAGGLVVTFILAVLLEGIVYVRNSTYAKAQIAAIKKTEQLNR